MSHTEDTTRELVRAIVQLEPLNGRAYASSDVFQDMAADYRSGHDTWREVTPQFVRYCMEVMPPNYPVKVVSGDRTVVIARVP